MAGSIYTLRIISEYSTKESQVFVPSKDQVDFWLFADEAEQHKGDFQYFYRFTESVTRKPRNMPMWND